MENKRWLSSFHRREKLLKFADSDFDLLIIGGGITGAGIALDAAVRGLKTLLIEKADFASGTSSKSTKLIHGGLRYLKQFDIALVREVGKERAIVHQLAPHLVVPEKMLLPIIKGGTFGKWSTSLGLKVYDFVADVAYADKRVMLDKKATLKKEPLLPGERVLGAGLYAEYRTDDARLTTEVLKTAVKRGAEVINYCSAESFVYKDGKVIGCNCIDELTGEGLTVRAKQVVSATGPWVDELRGKDKSLKGKHLLLTKGVHIVVPKSRLPIRQSIYFDVEDGRMIFAIPRANIVYIGTTDTVYEEKQESVSTSQKDVDYLLSAVNDMFPDVELKQEDIVSNWAGLRPLIFEPGKSASEISRRDELFESPSGLISIAGGKLTGYRIMAKKAVDLVVKKLDQLEGRTFEECITDQILLSGSSFSSREAIEEYRQAIRQKLKGKNIPSFYSDYLVSNYGTQTNIILDKMESLPADDSQILLTLAELWYCIQFEGVCKVTDFYIRRTGRLYFYKETIKPTLRAVLSAMKGYFSWTDEEEIAEHESMREALFLSTEFL